jgi:hypothetical protein
MLLLLNTAIDNSMIAPDLAPDPSSLYHITDSAWSTFGKLDKHLYICIVTSHKTVKGLGNNNMLLLHHQAAAARELHLMITEKGDKRSEARIIEAASMFLSSQIQQSAYGPWRIHLDGAKALFGSWRRPLTGCDDYALYNITIIDIYGTTMAPSRLLSMETIAQHSFYSKMLARLDVDPLCTLTPVPQEILNATIAINICRARNEARDGSSKDHLRQQGLSLDAVLVSLQQFDPNQWANELPSRYTRHSRSWMLLATCYSSATILYLFQSYKCCSIDRPAGTYLSGPRQAAYQDLTSAITETFKQRMQKGTHYKFILWPMVIGGIEAAARGNFADIEFLCRSLETMTLDLGTFAMREAAVFLRGLWDDCAKRRESPQRNAKFDWDDIFMRAPLFLM